jgi:hypothetical protein
MVDYPGFRFASPRAGIECPLRGIFGDLWLSPGYPGCILRETGRVGNLDVVAKQVVDLVKGGLARTYSA